MSYHAREKAGRNGPCPWVYRATGKFLRAEDFQFNEAESRRGLRACEKDPHTGGCNSRKRRPIQPIRHRWHGGVALSARILPAVLRFVALRRKVKKWPFYATF
jgi:hypothetical protein